MKDKIKKILILGAGGLRIGQAGEFDYSGSQAIKALKDENYTTILVNPNIATVQTDHELADRVYLQPLNVETVVEIIDQERPDGILLGFGGQTALNLGLALDQGGYLKKYGTQVLGTPVKTIKITEDRHLFKESLSEIGVKTCKSMAVSSVQDALEAADKIGYPVMVRGGYSLGGLGSGVAKDKEQLVQRAKEALSHSPQILIEEYLKGWKEIEYEVMRDSLGNAIVICNMENFDPMGIHTGESIVIAPSQTLNNQEYFFLREIALKTIAHLGVIGECNIQYGLNPENGDYRVIEVNARLSRSSALASKATGYPIAYVAAKVSLGWSLHEIKNQVTQVTTAFFEPALDYVVVKIPRWDMQKFRSVDRRIGSEMKSVGEVMGIGRSFPEALQKAIRMLNQGFSGISGFLGKMLDPKDEIINATDRRLFAIYKYLKNGGSIEEINQLSGIDLWFLQHIKHLCNFEDKFVGSPLTKELILEGKKLGFSDAALAEWSSLNEEEFRNLRISFGIQPVIKQIDTLAAEFSSQTNYLYTTYHGECNDVEIPVTRAVAVLGSGPYCIGSSVEFDWCAVNALKTLVGLKEETLMINSNPETVSTDFDHCHRLYFEELTQERVRDIFDLENPKGIVVSVGGQIANNIAHALGQAGYPLLGTPFEAIDCAEDREKFSRLLSHLEIDQPLWTEVRSVEGAKAFIKEVGYPVLVRPSYVLSGAAMQVVHEEDHLCHYLEEATLVSKGKPVVISKFIEEAKELEIDGVAKDGHIIVEAISEHIENAGVHSGDATIVLPPQKLYLETVRQAKQITAKIAFALKITGPFNIQFIAKDNTLKVIECNLRASRSFPFVSKATKHNFIDIAIKALLNISEEKDFETLELDWVAVKSPQFSYNRLKGTNPVAQVEMASTGEVACFGDYFLEAFFRSWLATGIELRGKRILVSVGGDKKAKLLPYLQNLKGWSIFATEGTYEHLKTLGIEAKFLHKASENHEPNVKTVISEQQVDLIINIPTNKKNNTITDGFTIRRLAVDHNTPLVTNLQVAQTLLQALVEVDLEYLPVKAWNDFGKKKLVEGFHYALL